MRNCRYLFAFVVTLIVATSSGCAYKKRHAPVEASQLPQFCVTGSGDRSEASFERPDLKPLLKDRESRLQQDRYFSEGNLECMFGHEYADGEPHQVGLALSGGGSKAAAYSMGVLAGLSDTGTLDSVDVISSVSGGGYAAYWFYARLLDRYQWPSRFSVDEPFEDVFSDCLIREYGWLECDPAEHGGLDYATCNLLNAESLCPNNRVDWKTGTVDRFRFQNHLRGYQDIFSRKFEVRRESRFGKDVARILGATAVRTVPNAITNMLFDWQVTLSPSLRAYERGIEATYGLDPVDCLELAQRVDLDTLPSTNPCSDTRPLRNPLAERGLSLAQIQSVRTSPAPKDTPAVPYWVINTTAGIARAPLINMFKTAFPDFEDSVFEISLNGYGSREYGYWAGNHPQIEVLNAVVASGAVFDSQQRELSPFTRVLAAGVLKALQLDWGMDINNPGTRPRRRYVHRSLPLPFYMFHRKGKHRKAPDIHLSDGGQSDNTGVYSLVRRGVKTIIYADAYADNKGKFKGLARLKCQLREKGLHLIIPEIEGFQEHACKKNKGLEGKPVLISPYEWKKPVLEGCIRATAQKDCRPLDKGKKEAYFASLHILKPALDWAFVKEQADACMCSTVESSMKDGNQYLPYNTDECRSALSALREREDYAGFPTEAFGQLVGSLLNRNLLRDDGTPIFPQHGTVPMTANSSSTLFAAYRELARWQARQIKLE